MTKKLSDTTEVRVRFNEADPLGIVWHGHYVRYFEDGREAFGSKYGIGYLDFQKQGFIVPVVSIHCDYKKSLRYGETMLIETTYIHCDAAKIIFSYRVFNKDTDILVATGESVQVFLDLKESILQLTNPPFFDEWKKRQKFT
ncbi:MAG: acyl-CoA thioesterase [Chitinophagaceae bacterium]|nr:acyl-CoA thioesterase [Chitinophagaceae bacterium]